MDDLLLLIRLLLAAVFAVAGTAKLADPQGSREALLAFRVPAAVSTQLAVMLPLAEITAAVLLVIVGTAGLGGALALVLLLGFVAGIAASMARGEAPDCHCFGQLHSRPAGPSTLIRNGVLAALAAFVVVAGWSDGGTSATAWVADVSPAGKVGILAAIGFALCALGWMTLLRKYGLLLLRIEALEAGGATAAAAAPAIAPGPATAAPAFRLPTVDGGELALPDLIGDGRAALLLFMDPSCGPCNAMLPEVAAWQTERAGVLRIAIVSRGGADANRAKVSAHGIETVLLQADRELWAPYGVTATPSAVLVDTAGELPFAIAEGPDAIRTLVDRHVPRSAAPASALTVHQVRPVAGVGEPLPDVALTELDGTPTSLASIAGEDTLVVFWDPACGFCDRMAPDLRRWEGGRADDAPALVLVSKGTAETNRAMGFDARVLIDAAFAAGPAVGVGGTPSAVRVDSDGRITSGVSVGADEVLALARQRPARR